MQSGEISAKLAVLDRDMIEKTVRDIHLLRAEAKFDALERYLAPEAVFKYYGNRTHFPYDKKYIGK